jgi:regulatory protein
MSKLIETVSETPAQALLEFLPEEHVALGKGVNPADVRFAAMNYLARREHSLQELRLKLRRRFDDDAIIEGELTRLTEENLQSDERFVQSFVRQRAGRGVGPVRIKREARERGVSSEQLSLAMQEADIDWVARAREVMTKKFGEGPAADIKEKARRVRFMRYRGFSQHHLLD